ncbi:hypothetical protein [Nocardia sp. NPDC006630]|uniref:hypothetical protein n=1 Tax=Nocardia sp. NPDC006630 TaxID=3157181 RepID=UPI0033B4352E
MNRAREWAKAPDFANDPEHRATVRRSTARDKQHYLQSGLTEIECRGCHAWVMVKKYSSFHTSVQWNPEARTRCGALQQARREGRNSAAVATCQHLSATIDYGVAEGIIPAQSPETDPDGYW